MNTIEQTDDPKRIADDLIHEHGLDGAIQEAVEGVAVANKIGDFYSLSIWREVRTLLRAKVKE